MIEFYDPISATWEVEGSSRGYRFKGSSSSSSSASNTNTQMSDNRKAASDGGIMAENSTVTVNNLDAGLARDAYATVGNVAGLAVVSADNAARNSAAVANNAMFANGALANTAIGANSNLANNSIFASGALANTAMNTNSSLANNAILSASAQSIAGQQINADVAKMAIGESNKNVQAQLGINADLSKAAILSSQSSQLKAQEQALNTVDHALSQTVSTLNDVNTQREISQRGLNENLAQMHDTNTAYAEALQKENNQTVKDLAAGYAEKIAKNAQSDAVTYVQYAVYAIVAIAVIFLAAKIFTKKGN